MAKQVPRRNVRFYVKTPQSSLLLASCQDAEKRSSRLLPNLDQKSAQLPCKTANVPPCAYFTHMRVGVRNRPWLNAPLQFLAVCSVQGMGLVRCNFRLEGQRYLKDRSRLDSPPPTGTQLWWRLPSWPPNVTPHQRPFYHVSISKACYKFWHSALLQCSYSYRTNM